MSDLGMRYAEVRQFTERLCKPLTVEDHVVQSMPDASPTRWHLAHTSWFFETFLLVPRGVKPYDPRFSYLFNSYYNAIGARVPRALRGSLSRPGVREVYAYRAHVDAQMRELLSSPGVTADLADLVELGLNHEQQHQELILTDIKHAFGLHPLHPVYSGRPARLAGSVPQVQWLSCPGGLVSIGHAGTGFAFDNESPRHEVFLRPFTLASRLVTCGEYRAFLDDGGYDRPELWLSDGWSQCRGQGWRAPLYWEREGSNWFHLTLTGWQPVLDDDPACHLSYYEADAFARWADARLPTEAEWETVAASLPVRGSFLEADHLHPAAHAGPASTSPSTPEMTQMFGEVWQWTASPYVGYPGYRPAAGALGEYNGKFMCNQFVLRGGSCATPRSHFRVTYRNFFPPDARWQFTGLRLARDL